jgi:hypothetical protein
MHLVIIAFIKVYIQPTVIYYEMLSMKSLFFPPKWHLGRGSNNLSSFRIVGFLSLRTAPASG